MLSEERKLNMKKMIILLTATVASFTLFGCATPRLANMEKGSAYQVKLTPTSPVTVTQVRAYRNGDEFVVSGRVKRMHRVLSPGRVALDICGPDGVLIKQKEIRVSGLSSRRKGRQELPFKFKIESVPPAGSTIHVQYRSFATAQVKAKCSKINM
ncbi:MAG: hypothetical protein L3J63_08115 [Geopsychrobacter sp.]|nr:hypothetical protein [Geopsychrobacter sp.]